MKGVIYLSLCEKCIICASDDHVLGQTVLVFKGKLAHDEGLKISKSLCGDAVALVIDVLCGYSLDSVGNACDIGTTDGGAVSIRSNCKATFTDTVFKNNSANGTSFDQGGGAIYVGWGTLNLNNVTMTGNSTTGGFGGAVNANSATLKVNGSTFESNKATYGGALTVSGTGSFQIDNSTFKQNSANDGGAVYAYGATLTVTGANTLFSENSAGRGGAIYLVLKDSTAASMTMTGGKFENNTSTTDGGALSLRSYASATFTDTVFKGNSVNGAANSAFYMHSTAKLNGATQAE